MNICRCRAAGNKGANGQISTPRETDHRRRNSAVIPVGKACLKQASFSEGNSLDTADDEMIEYPYIDQGQRFLEAPGQATIGIRRFGYARRVIVYEDDCSGIMLE